MQVEDITGVSLTTGGTTKQQRHLTVGDGLLGEIVVDDQRVPSIVPYDQWLVQVHTKILVEQSTH